MLISSIDIIKGCSVLAREVMGQPFQLKRIFRNPGFGACVVVRRDVPEKHAVRRAKPEKELKQG